jgi:hypothetical protein
LDEDAAEDAGQEGRLQIDRVRGSEGSIVNRSKSDASARIVEEDAGGRRSGTAGGAE